MRTHVHDNSLAAIWSMRDSGELPARELEVYEALRKFGAMTREQIAARTSMKEGSACGRVNKLMKRGLVVGVANCVNDVTDKLNEIVDLAPHRKAMHMPKKQTPLFADMAAA
jgi:hypothetical protein